MQPSPEILSFSLVARPAVRLVKATTASPVCNDGRPRSNTIMRRDRARVLLMELPDCELDEFSDQAPSCVIMVRSMTVTLTIS